MAKQESTVSVNRDAQFKLFDSPVIEVREEKRTTDDARVFNNPDPHEIYLGMMPLKEHLEQVGSKESLIVRRLLAEQDWSSFEQRYAPVGRAPYAPQCMLGLILYGFLQGTNSLRGLEKLARLNLGCMWVTGGICPDHANIGRFINLHDDLISGEFFIGLTASVLKETGSSGHRLAGDGTVIEAAGSYYGLLKEEAVKQQLEAATEQAEQHPRDARKQAQAEQAQRVKDTLELRKQAKQRQGKSAEHLCVSATDPDAMVQPLKRNRGSGPSYKPSVLANEQRVVVAQAVDPSRESAVLGLMLDQAQAVTGQSTEELLLDAGYFNDRVIDESLARNINLLCPEGKQVGKPKHSEKHFPKGMFTYLEDEDAYRCPQGGLLYPKERYKGNEQAQAYVKYMTPSCAECPLKSQCTKSAKGRMIKRYPGDEAKDALRMVMQQPGAKKSFKQRQAMVEPVFSALRMIQGLTKFKRRGLEGVKREFTLHVLAYNLSRALAYLLYLLNSYRMCRLVR